MKKEKSKNKCGSDSHHVQNSSSSSKLPSPVINLLSDNKRKRKKLPDEDDSLILMSCAEQRVIRGSLPSKKQKLHELPMTNDWTVCEKKIETEESDSDSSSSNDDSDTNSLNDSNDDKDYVPKLHIPLKLEDQSKISTLENFEDFDMNAFNYMIESESENELYAEKAKKRIERKKRKLSYKNKSVRITPIPARNAMAVLLNHPASITLYQYVSVSVLSGTVSINGSEVKAGCLPVKVFSSEMTGLVEVKSEKYENIWAQKDSYTALKYEVNEITCDKRLTLKVLKKYTDISVLIIVERCIFPPNLQFLELYYPDELQPKLEIKRGHYNIEDSDGGIKFGNDATTLGNHIITAIRAKKLRDEVAPRVLIYGQKNIGKSSLLRFLINKVLNVFPQAYYLDTDPGQTEFTPPGVVSLTKVDKPIIDPPFCHQRKSESMVFIGSVSPATSPDMYTKSIAKLEKIYDQQFKEDVLFVNTMGWMKGFGLECLKNILKIIEPTILIEIAAEDDGTIFDYSEWMATKTDFFQIQPQFEKESAQPKISAEILRNLSLLSYFGKCQPAYDQPRYLNEFKPYSVNWDKIPIYVFGTKIPPHKLVEAVNGSIVALCEVEKSSVLESEVPKFQKTLEDEPMNECLGYGLVRAIDTTQHLLLIVTPLRPEQLAKVNAIIKGKVLTPPPVFLNQPYVETPIPFTDERTVMGKASIFETSEAYQKAVPARHKRIKKK